jgi:hypothetical protein
MTISLLGIDIAKSTFQLHGADITGKAVLKKRLPSIVWLKHLTHLLISMWRRVEWCFFALRHSHLTVRSHQPRHSEIICAHRALLGLTLPTPVSTSVTTRLSPGHSRTALDRCAVTGLVALEAPSSTTSSPRSDLRPPCTVWRMAAPSEYPMIPREIYSRSRNVRCLG